ncbi:MAG: carboxyltransferase domain-containing protein [Roseovarius sp.]|nr:carboxyltransferase domain-containing protein [Roseovarius sp.]
MENYREKTFNGEILDQNLIVQLNWLEGRDRLKRLHPAREYWGAALGFRPGLHSLMPPDLRSRLAAPKRNPPRMWMPKGAIGINGSATCIYPDQTTPGGCQIFVRTPMPTWDKTRLLPAFEDRLALVKAGDRIKFALIEREECDHIEAKVAEGGYPTRMWTTGVFRSVRTKPGQAVLKAKGVA